MFRVGQKVVCVKSWIGCEKWQAIHKGSIYHIRDVVVGMQSGKALPGVLLAEITNGIGPRGVEYNYVCDRFRPIVERKTSIEIFTRMLKPAGVDA